MMTTFPLRLALILYSLVFAGVLLASLAATGGQFFYTIDDPYIHLALADNLPAIYGTDPREPTSVSSSILYPWLLVPFAKLGVSAYAPLAIGFLAGLLSVALFVRLERQLTPAPATPAWARVVLAVTLAAGCNLFGLIFMGMEHTLHLALTLAIFSALLNWTKREDLPAWLWPALILAPLLRYEGLLLSLAAVALLLATTPKRLPLLALALIVATQLLAAFYYLSLGFTALPNSVLLKQSAFDLLRTGADPFTVTLSLLLDLFHKLGFVGAWWCLFGGLALAGLAVRKALSGRTRALLLVLALCCFGHLLLGQFGWLERYHSYLLPLLLGGLLLGTKDWCKTLAAEMGTQHLTLLALITGFILLPLQLTMNIPRAGFETYAQPAQIKRFITDYWKAPVAAFDIGYVSWQNPYPVADLFGLGSAESRRVRATFGNWPPEILRAYLNIKKAKLVIGSDNSVEPLIMPEWTRLARLSLPEKDDTFVYWPMISFYVVDPADLPRAHALLKEWSKDLPAGVTFELADLNAAASALPTAPAQAVGR